VVWELEFGSWVLLRPGRINAYAQAVIQTVREDKHERGCFAEERVLGGDLTCRRPEERLPADEERFVLLAMHKILVEPAFACANTRTPARFCSSLAASGSVREASSSLPRPRGTLPRGRSWLPGLSGRLREAHFSLPEASGSVPEAHSSQRGARGTHPEASGSQSGAHDWQLGAHDWQLGAHDWQLGAKSWQSDAFGSQRSAHSSQPEAVGCVPGAYSSRAKGLHPRRNLRLKAYFRRRPIL
jgi:hypothetical protein